MNGEEMHPRLLPLPETVVAAMSLRELPGVDADIPTGWALAALSLVTAILSSRPGAAIHLTQEGSRFRSTITGGALNDSESTTHPQIITWFASEIASSLCSACGRPGERRTAPAGSWCDSCWLLRTGRTPDFEPRLPLLEHAAEAQRSLPPIGSLPRPAAGWAPLLRSVLKRLGDGSGRDVVFTDRGPVLRVTRAPNPPDEVAQVNTTLNALCRQRCRYCSRLVIEESPTPGQCAGCLWVQARGWEIVPAFAEDGAPR